LYEGDLGEITKQEPVTAQIRKRKWRWIGHTVRKPEESIEKAGLDWNPQGIQRCARPRKTWRRSVEEEISKKGKTWRRGEGVGKGQNKIENFTSALCSERNNRR
jgi:hypothetical protein